MRCYNWRSGFACNSSSSHSIVLLPEGTTLSDDSPGNEFGWEFFTLTSPESKGAYLWYQVQQAFARLMSSDHAALLAGAVLKQEVPDDYQSGYIDHQSTWLLPFDWDCKGLNREFIAELATFLERPDIVIAGGNDNSDTEHYATQVGTEFLLPKGDYLHRVVARRDSRGYWTCFNRLNGSKFRISFTDTPVDASGADVPELVDIKLTDHCAFGCAYCYQASTKEGQHAPKAWLWHIAKAMADMKVFEVAIGGGEPTTHPDLLSFATQLRRDGVIPNLTTRSLKWVPTHAALYADIFGAIAFSVDSATHASVIHQTLVNHGFPTNKAVFQHVLGAHDLTRADFEALLRFVGTQGMTLTLLGYKPVGFGASHPVYPADWWIEVFSSLPYNERPRLQLDTALAQQSQAQLEAAGVPKWSYHVHEGRHSAYFDATTARWYPSSYHAHAGLQVPMTKGWNGTGIVAKDIVSTLKAHYPFPVP